jgi:rod shape-determining protein MreC
MAAIPSRHRSLVLLAVVVAAQILLLAVQIRERHGRLIRVWAITALAPFERAGGWGMDHVRGTWKSYFALRQAARENEELRRERDNLKLQINFLRSRAADAERLGALVNFRQERSEIPLLPARVISTSADSSSQTVFIDRGEKDGVRADMGVITPDGVAGKVIAAYPHISQVLLITDKESGVGAMVEESRLLSPASGTGGPLLALKYIAEDEKVKAGEHIVTSGMDRIFPKDFPVGTVLDVQPGTPFLQINIQPAARLNHLEEVIVLLSLSSLDIKKEIPAPAAPATPLKKPAKSEKP